LSCLLPNNNTSAFICIRIFLEIGALFMQKMGNFYLNANLRFKVLAALRLQDREADFS